MFQFDWHEYFYKLQRKIGGRTWILKRHVAVFLDDKFIGSDVDFYRIISDTYSINLPTNTGYYQNLSSHNYRRFCEKMNRTFVYLTFSSDGNTIGSLLFMLYSDFLPRTCEYFMSFCNGKNWIDGTNLSYKKQNVHRIVKNGWIQSGDIKINDLESEFISELTIPEESFCISHNRRGVISLSNAGKNLNGPQFIISLKPNSWMDYYYVAFGQLVDGVKTLKLIEEIPTVREKPLKNIKILDCGEYSFKEEPRISEDEDAFLDYKSQNGENETSEPSISVFNKFPDIQPWLYNISDKLDLRDVPSILMAEKYLKGLYCLSSDFLPGMDMNLLNRDCLQKETLESETTSIADQDTKEQIQNICRKIINCTLENFCKKGFSETIIDQNQIVQWILDIAQEMINGVIEKTANSDLDDNLKTSGLVENEITEKIISLIEEVLKSAASLVVETLNGEESKDA
ncbi:probable inactive peptidyl-prolyl cis-trans isomerase-like 6 [Belonocnema kinseyi]|uniref:probable inactive peptidyl-prolyl cis-trans isomerase-like 6 n=1 Tax=Belonocnema kinseyi TaxID=2817044 RepID=UPI00143D90CB|nr:probable inactive peptidyl-prolyl cis-trans isomerase-like 6 [Belonocnema kinseyi]